MSIQRITSDWKPTTYKRLKVILKGLNTAPLIHPGVAKSTDQDIIDSPI